MESFRPRLQISGLTDTIPVSALEDILELFCQTMGLSSNMFVSLVFCSQEEMSALNKKYRGVGHTTDVLSFPADDGAGLFPPDESGYIFLGEIIVDMDYILRANPDKIPLEALQPIFIHGLLHLLGFDHLNARQRTEMEKLEEKINILTKQER